jgi:ribonucleoside-diphosphate reductase alpha chain
MSTKGQASGPVSFMRVFDVSTEVIKQGGRRRGANMAVLSAYHPDIVEFVIIKKYGLMKNFNLSVAVDDKFMNAVKKNKRIKLINPRTKKAVKKISAKALFELVVETVWETGDPGILFIDGINRKHVLRSLGKIEATNPCGEQPLLPYESCNLGSINLTKIVSEGEIDWDKLKRIVRTAVHFLDNVIDASRFPLFEIKLITKANRKIGLGVMGFAEMLIKLGIPYDSKKALDIAEEVMKFIANEARKKSMEIGLKRGSFPNYRKSSFYRYYKAMRNATVTTIAPTGTISIIAGCSSGIEPLFALSFKRENVLGGINLYEMNKHFARIARKKGFYSKKLVKEVAEKGSVQEIKGIPSDIKRIFVTAHDIKPEWHVRMQAAFQKHVDNGVSKTVNLKSSARKEEIKKIFLLANELGCKGITVYRDKSKKEQVLNVGISEDECKKCLIAIN